MTCAVLLLLAAMTARGEQMSAVHVYTGASDASAAVALPGDLLLVANDEDNLLRVYSATQDGAPLRTFPLDDFLGTAQKVKRREADLEGGTWCNGLIYWIGSHGRNKDGKTSPARHRLFACRWLPGDNGGKLELVGRAYSDLIEDILMEPRLSNLGLYAADRPDIREQKDLAPKKEGLNIEGLSRTADDKGLLIGFRQPTPGGRALIVPLLNPEAVVLKGERPQFGEPILLDLGGRGIRSLEYSEASGGFLIAAAHQADPGHVSLYRWSRRDADPPEAVPMPALPDGFVAEGLVPYADGRLLLLSDDGAALERAPASVPGPRFRAVWLQAPPAPPD